VIAPSFKVAYSIYFEVTWLSDEMVRWFQLVGGETVTVTEWVGRHSKKVEVPYVKYGKGKQSYYRQDGTNRVRINFHGDDADVATMFLIKFLDFIESHNLKNYKEFK